MYQLIRPILFQLEPERAHKLAAAALKFWPQQQCDLPEPIEVMGLQFPNRIGLAAGFDKDAQYIDGLGKLGFGFIEVGTVTPKPQLGNPQPRIFRIPEKQALINRMGFNNQGVEKCVANCQQRKFTGILGINIGKNASTPMHEARNDYLNAFTAVHPVADYIAINVSSPNTENLRSLQNKGELLDLLSAIKNKQRVLASEKHVPVVVKIAPDLSDEQLVEIAYVITECGIEGVIATNTLLDKSSVADCINGNEQGGLSGAPLLSQSTHVVSVLRQELQSNIPIIAVGGIQSVADAQAKIAAGASLVQLYTGLIYQGPGLVADCARALV